jgi:hypothetical protein
VVGNHEVASSVFSRCSLRRMETSDGHDESIDFLTCESTIACSMGPKSYAQTGTTERSTSIPEMKIDRRVGLPLLAPLKLQRPMGSGIGCIRPRPLCDLPFETGFDSTKSLCDAELT